MNELALFAGAGGGILGGKLLGWRTVCAVEINAYARRVLLARQRDGMLERFPIWDDIRTFDGRPWRNHVDVVSGGFPCQDISYAGKGKGIDGERSGLWSEMVRIVGEVRPRFVFVENSPALLIRGIDRVLGGLAAMGFDARWGIVGAGNVGLPHRRERIWLVAYTNQVRCDDTKHDAAKRRHDAGGRLWEATQGSKRWPHRFDGTFPADRVTDWSVAKTGSVRGINGLADWVDRLESIGNGQVPAVAALAWKLLAPTPPAQATQLELLPRQHGEGELR